MTFLPGMQGRTTDFENRILASHNRERQILGLPQLEWDAGLAHRATRWAEHLAATGKFEHSPNIPGEPLEGENIWGGTSGAFFPEDMVGLWISEKAHFVEGVFPANSKTGRVQDVSHYTQIVWRRTEAVGCGMSQRGDEEIMVCRYSEPGNRRGVDPLYS
ncbi:CAP domain-containing protein [Sphingorhabdus sp.]|uniref:CAP domain-containing protein n=1 Tax=Sphingorhabdus sp. TaxID=1902408 RepID=UPI00391A03C0